MLRFLLLVTISLFSHISTANAAAFFLTELASPDMGVAGAGNGAVARDAATAFFNPAAMTLLCLPQALIGVQTYDNRIRFHQDPGTPIKGPNGTRPSKTLPSGALYFAASINDRFKYGFSFNSPCISYLHYSRDWTGRFLCQKDEVYMFLFGPSFACRINKCWSIGAGLSIGYTMLRQRLALNPSLYERTTRITAEGTIKDKFDKGSWGYNVSLLWNYSPMTRLGLVWRSKQFQEEKGLPTYTPLGITPDVTTHNTLITPEILSKALIPQNNIITMPSTLTLSGYQQLIPGRLALLFSQSWILWHEFRKTIVTSNNTGVVQIRRRWQDTALASIGLEFTPTEKITLQSGCAFELSPCKFRERQSADFPVGKQRRYAAGAIYALTPCTKIGVAGEYQHMHDVTVNNEFLKGWFRHANSLFLNFTLTKLF
jgi:long-chain fatty acid transport protein